MVQIKVKYLNIYPGITRKQEELIAFSKSPTLKELIDKLCTIYKSEFREAVLDRGNKLKLHALILVDGLLAKELDTKLKDGEMVVFMLTIAGG